ncbi:MAG: pyrroline-5-carboxylate reductase [Gammaproteobacteria bacterium]
MNSTPTIALIGTGNMGGAIIQGLIAAGTSADHLWASGPEVDQLNALHQKYGLHITSDNQAAARAADIIILAIKPQIILSIAAELSGVMAEHQPLIISIAGGITEPVLRQALGHPSPAIVRAMPNTPAMIGEGATALFANPFCSELHKQQAQSIFAAVGTTVWLEQEDLLYAVTALSGSGPAYFFLLLEALEQAAAAMGLSPELAIPLIQQTALGSAKMALAKPHAVAQLRQAVTSPQGGTERALNVLEAGGFRQLVQTAVEAARDRYIELGH